MKRDRGQVTGDRWQVTGDTQHVNSDAFLFIFCVLKINIIHGVRYYPHVSINTGSQVCMIFLPIIFSSNRFFWQTNFFSIEIVQRIMILHIIHQESTAHGEKNITVLLLTYP